MEEVSRRGIGVIGMISDFAVDPSGAGRSLQISRRRAPDARDLFFSTASSATPGGRVSCLSCTAGARPFGASPGDGQGPHSLA